MTLRELVEKLSLKVLTSGGHLDRPITGGYASDLLSDVLANSREGQVWITLQIHKNILGVAVARELSAILLVNGRAPDDEIIRKADEEKIPLLLTDLGTYRTVVRMGECGIL